MIIDSKNISNLHSRIACDSYKIVKLFYTIVYKLLDVGSQCNDEVICRGCRTSNFIGYRFKCISCYKYDLCADCMENKKCSHEHLLSHPMIFIGNPLSAKESHFLSLMVNFPIETLNILLDDDVIHDGIKCSFCSNPSIKGIRVKCISCFHHDLCWFCFKKKKLSNSLSLSCSFILYLVPVRNTFDILQDVLSLTNTPTRNGYFCSVKVVNYKSKKCALKTVKLRGNQDYELYKSLLDKLFTYGEIHSNNILKFYARSIKLHVDHAEVLLLMEFMEQGSVRDIIERNKSFPLCKKFNWILSTIKGIRHIHSKDIVHQDISPDNIFVNLHDEVKIGDIGIAIHDFKHCYFRERNAPPLYSAPELISGKFSCEADIFSYGLVVYEIFTYKSRMLDDGFADLFLPVNFPDSSKIFMSLIEKCVLQKPEERPMAQDIEQALQTFNDGFWSSIQVMQQNYSELSSDNKDRLFTAYYRAVQESLKW